MKNLTGTDQVRFDRELDYNVKNWQIRRMLLDMDTYLPGDILCKVDRASMKYSLEARCPILDQRVMEYSFRLPHSFKDHNGCQKYILKEIAYDYIPRELLDRKKTGFSVPLDKWLRGPLKNKLTDYASPAFLKQQGLFNADATAKLITDWLGAGDGGAYTGSNYSRIIWRSSSSSNGQNAICRRESAPGTQQPRPQDVMRSQCLQDALSLSKNEAVHNAAKDAALCSASFLNGY